MYELLTGNPPYYHEDIETLYNNIRNGIHLKIYFLIAELEYPSDIS